MSKPKINPPRKTKLGTYFVAADRQRIYTSFRYEDAVNQPPEDARARASTEAQRLADTLTDCDRVLVLKVVAIRKKNVEKPIDNSESHGKVEKSQEELHTSETP